MKIVQICGGLGCQLLDTATYYSLAKEEESYVDKQYFESATKQPCNGPWDLERYCIIPLESLPAPSLPAWELRHAQRLAEMRLYNIPHQSPKLHALSSLKSAMCRGSSIYRRITKQHHISPFSHIHDYICEGSESSRAIHLLKSAEGRKHFELNPALASQANQTSLDLSNQKSLPLAIHVRHGDYLTLGSKLSGINFPVSLLRKAPIQVLKPGTYVIWISDSEVDLESIKIQLPHLNHRCFI